MDQFVAHRPVAAAMIGTCCGVSLIVFVLSWAALTPTQFGLAYNSVTGSVDDAHPYEGGRHLLGPTISFLVFPAYTVQLMFDAAGVSSPTDTVAPPIDARTGRDLSDPDSGGQPVKLSLSFWYRIERQNCGKIYRAFSTQYNARFLQYARQAVSDVAQGFEPTLFWTARERVSAAMQQRIGAILSEYVTVTGFQLLRVDFSPKFEDTIVSIQLATQQRTTSEYRQRVVSVVKAIDIIESQTAAQITAINAHAAARARLVVNDAAAHGFNMTQSAKADGYAALQHALGLDRAQLLEYLRIKSLLSHTPDKLVVALEHP